ncbi:MAG: G1 family glutamic endopeptidase [Candidatus Acidiferrales bacterium]
MLDIDSRTVDSGIPGVRVFKHLPSNFDPHQASDWELAAHGLPIRPDPRQHRRAHAEWEKIITGKYQRVFPSLFKIDRNHAPCIRLSETHTGQRSMSGTSSNWSGIVIDDPSNPFAVRNVAIQGTWSVPRTAFNVLGISNNTSIWVGIDGSNSPDVLQAGVDVANGIGVPHAYAWIEWYPQTAVGVDSNQFPVEFGDIISVQVTFASDFRPEQGTVGMVNQTKRLYFSGALSTGILSATKLVGNCVEWIVERPTINGQICGLAEYGVVNMLDCQVLMPNGQRYFPGEAPTGTTIDFTMLQNGAAVSEAPVISAAPTNLADGIRFVCTL